MTECEKWRTNPVCPKSNFCHDNLKSAHLVNLTWTTQQGYQGH